MRAPRNTGEVTDPVKRSSGSDTERLVLEVVRPAIRALSAYPVTPAHDRVKLDAMENPYSLPPALREEWLDVLRNAELNRYPDARAADLKEKLHTVFGISRDASILLGNGSDEIIQIIQTATGGPVLTPVPTFVMYETIAGFADAEFVGIPLDTGFGLDADAMLSAIRRHRPAVVFIAYPNNPTGNLFDEKVIRRIIDAANGLVVIDEAYHAFAKQSLMHCLEQYPNVVVMRTLSKLGLAGLRLGFAVGHPAWIGQFEKVRLPYNVGVLTQKSVEFALEHLDVFMRQTEEIKAERRRVHESLNEAGYDCFRSDANFILFRCRDHSAGEVFQSLLNGEVLIKNLSDAHPALAECLRVTIGTPSENDRFLAAIPGSASSR
ncbi:MAG: Histidinol-phosphate aminotransferase 2 [Gammaproteobacteria bacterium]|nr:Histidinol-phosphate aminotransferase 2 [Gammaproteobacteria bacterium]